jgi:uncharacterized membrane protein YkvA (DUF1232 family)
MCRRVQSLDLKSASHVVAAESSGFGFTNSPLAQVPELSHVPAGPCTCSLKFSRSIMSDPPQLPARFSAPRWYSAPRLWRTLKKATLTAGKKTLLTALILFYCLQDRDTPTWAKGVIIGALGYLVLPMDMIPDLLPGAGYGDDWGALVAALGTVAAYVKDEHKTKANAQMKRLFGLTNPQTPPEFAE